MTGSYVVPIRADWPLSQIEQILDSVNGYFMPGGGNALWNPAPVNGTGVSNFTTFAYKAFQILEYAYNKNVNGQTFVIWGTCLGNEILQTYFANTSLLMTYISGEENITHTISVPDPANSKIYSGMDPSILEFLETTNATFYNHMYAGTPSSFAEYGLNETFNIVATTISVTGIEYVATMEHVQYPIFGVQFHSEKAIFILNNTIGANHDPQMIQASQYYANFIANNARLNNQSFADTNELYARYIDNWHPYLPPNSSDYMYIFPMMYMNQF